MLKTDDRPYSSALLNTAAAQGKSEGRAEGRAEGEARVLLIVLESCGIAVSDEARERIEGCHDQAQLEAWARRATKIDKVEDLFA